jgi:hypothetical protein
MKGSSESSVHASRGEDFLSFPSMLSFFLRLSTRPCTGGELGRRLDRSIYPFALAIVVPATTDIVGETLSIAAHHLIRCGRPIYWEA